MFNTWINKPKAIVEESNAIHITAGKETNLFVDPLSDYRACNAPIYTVKTYTDFTLSCKVQPDFTNTYDAGALMLYIDETNWVKLAFESTDMGHNAVVSVVTNEYSDDANGEIVYNKSIWMKITKKDKVVGLYYSLDSSNWHMVRVYRHNITDNDELCIGLLAQCPMSDECTVHFCDIKYTKESVQHFRQGV